MYAGILGGPRPRANALSSLARTGHVSPLARRPAAGAVQQAHGPAAGRRPGPQPMSASRTAATTALNSKTRRAADQVVHYTREEVFQMNSDARLRRRMEAMPYARYNVHNVPADKRTPAVDIYDNPVGKEAYTVGELWVYASTINDGFGTRRYWVYNTQTKVLVSFEPERGIAAKNRSYMSEKASFQNYATGMGTLGQYGEVGVYGAAAGMLTFGAVYEYGAAYAVGTAVRAYVVEAAKGAGIRMLLDAGTQLTVGTVTSSGTLGDRVGFAFNDYNIFSTISAAAVDAGKLKWCGKLLAAFGSAAVTNAVSIKGANADKYKGNWLHLVDLSDKQERLDYIVAVIAGTVFDQMKEYGGTRLERVMREAPSLNGYYQTLKYHRIIPRVFDREVSKTQLEVLRYEIGLVMETGKKIYDNLVSDERDRAKKAAAKHHLRPAQPKQ